MKVLKKITDKNIVIFGCIIVFFSMLSMTYADETKSDKKELASTQGKQKVRKNPTPFIPSEKINADSSISFPVDI